MGMGESCGARESVDMEIGGEAWSMADMAEHSGSDQRGVLELENWSETRMR